MKIKSEVLDIRGTVTECPPVAPLTCEKVVYQAVRAGLGNISNGGRYDRQRRAWVKPYDPMTPAQLARRSKFAEAVATWQVMSAEQKKAWKTDAKNKSISTFSAYISAFMRR
jgi:hypothetical protein